MTEPMTEPGPPVLHLVRHGESDWNVAGRIQGQSPDAGGLTSSGRAQAAASAVRLAEQAPGASAIVASDLPRARETALIIADRLGLPVEFDAELREQHLGAFQGHRFADRRPDGDGTWQDSIDALWREPFTRPPGGEGVADLYYRVHRALTGHAERCADADVNEIIIVTHGGPVRVATAPQPPSPGVALVRGPVANASITAWRMPCPAL